MQQTGRVKSAVMQGAGTILAGRGGIVLIVEPLHSIGTDQARRTRREDKGIFSIYLDDIPPSHEESLSSFLSSPQNTFPIFIFTSPQGLQKVVWRRTVDVILQNDLLRLVCIDEAHMLASVD